MKKAEKITNKTLKKEYPKFKGAIFDVDGVIVDTAHIHHKSWEIVFRKYGIDFTFADFKKNVDGKPRAKGARTVMPQAADKLIEDICADKQKNFENIMKTGKIKVFKSTVDFIKMLKKRSIKLAMASSSRNASPILKKVKVYPYFDAEVEGASLKRGKPFPDIFLTAAKKLGLKPDECIVFEDAQIGIDAAVNAGIKCVAINRDKSHSIKGANLKVNDFRELSYKKITGLFR
jgi:beta-phosphoglucomutase